MKYQSAIIFLFLLFSIDAAAGDGLPITKHYLRGLKRNTIYLEFFGNAFSWSINYDLIVKANSSGMAGFRLGIGSAENEPDTSTLREYPFELYYLSGKNRDHLELGIGYTAQFGKKVIQRSGTIYSKINFTDYYLFRIGYRLQHLKGGPMAKIAINPYFYHDYIANGKLRFSIFFGFGAGYTF